MSEPPVCPCDRFDHPSVIKNPPGLEFLRYRVGDYTTFREALLRRLTDADGNLIEQELLNWRPTARGDLALQMVEWFAYLADILTFYNERIAGESYLRTAALPESLQRLIRILGYRPRPGIGAAATLAALLTGPKALTLPAGFAIQSKPGPGKEPQIFELEAASRVAPPDAVAADAAADSRLTVAPGASVLLAGAIGSVKPGDELLVLARGWDGTNTDYRLRIVASVAQEKDPRGRPTTRITFTSALGLPANAQFSDYRLLRSAQSAHLYQYDTDHVIAFDHLHLESIKRDMKTGDPLLLVRPNKTPDRQLVSVTRYTEFVWYANTPDRTAPTKPPTQQNVPGIPIPHTRPFFRPTFSLQDASAWDADRDVVQVRFNWQEVGPLIGSPRTSVAETSLTLSAAPPAKFPEGTRKVILEDAGGVGVIARGTETDDGAQLSLTDLPDPAVSLSPPLQVLFDLLSVSRGKTAPSEVLGSGDAAVAGQEFVLQKSPLTYLLSAESTSGQNYRSTLRVWVDDVEWQEAPSFFEQAPDARFFVTREDEENKTRVQFGDGINGARLPTGANNVVARYRYGSGAEAPEAGTLTVILEPQPGLASVRNPVPAGGGADPDPPQQVRRYAPRSALTFGRAISGDDYETVAAQTPGVARARAYWAWDAAEQRTLVTVYVGDDAAAVDAARTALRGAADPNRPLVVKQATMIPIDLTLSLRTEPAYRADAVIAAVSSALLAEETGLFGVRAVRIGASVWESQIYERCLRVPGVVAVHALQLQADRGAGFVLEPGPRYDPGEGKVFQLRPDHLHLGVEAPGNV